MRDLDTFAVIPFDDRDISLAELIAFTSDHQSRMIANDIGGFLSARIAATSQALQALEDTLADDQSRLGLRMARVLAKKTFREALPPKVEQIVAAVVARYGPDSPEVTECIPQGRSIFTTCRDDQLETHLTTLLTAITAHQADLGAPLVTTATNLRNTWAAVHSASETATGNKTSTEAEKFAARRALQLELFKNLLTIALQFPRQPEKIALYMQQHLLENPQSPAEPEPPPGPA